MKILKIVPCFHPSRYAGGIETLAREWAKSLAQDYGCEVYILTSTTIVEPKSYPEDGHLAIEVKRLRCLRLFTRPVIPALLPSLYSLVRSFKPDIVHHYIPLVQDSLVARIATRLNIPFVVTFAADPILSEDSPYLQSLLEKVYSSISIMPTLRMASKVISTTKSYRNISTYLPNIDASKIEVVYQGVDIDYYHPPTPAERETAKTSIQSKYGISFEPNVPIIGFVGRMVPYKGAEYLIKAARELADTQFVLVGDNPQGFKPADMPRNVRLVGYVPYEDLRSFYWSFDITANPSINRMDSVPLTTLESMACGTPIIITDVGGNKELFDKSDFPFGKLISPKSQSEITRAIVEILAKEAEFKKGARNEAIKYSWSRVVQDLYNVYTRLLEQESVREM